VALEIKRRGRPRKADTIAKEQAILAAKVKPRSDKEILSDLITRFTVLNKVTAGAIAGNIRSAVITGAPGVGKSYNVEGMLFEAGESRNTPFEIVRGGISGVELYKLGYRMRQPGSVVLLDDADAVFNDEEALNVLKALCDSNKQRSVSWLKDSNTLRQEDVPQRYDFNGSMLFISNLNFQEYIDLGKNKFVPHFEALMSRSLYLDLRIHYRNEIAVWIEHIAVKGKMLQAEGLTPAQGDMVLNFIREHRDNLRDLSLRTVQKLAGMIRSDKDWATMARVCLLKN
jgi:hypothetical protein